MAEILTLDYVSADNNKVITGLGYIKEYSFVPRKNMQNKFYVSGMLQKKEKLLSFKVFEDAVVQAFKNTNLVGQVLNLNVTVNEYRGQMSLIINSFANNEGIEYDMVDFIRTHDVQSNYNEFTKYLTDNLSQDELAIVNGVFSIPEDGFTRFALEYAGKAYHDACAGGVLYHTLKMLRLFDFVCGNDYRIETMCEKLPKFKQLCRVAIILHDFGKVVEMRDGVYTASSIVSHRVRGVEYLARNREAVIKVYGEDGYDYLITCLVGHHGEFEGETPTTVYAYMVHVIDMLDTCVTHTLEGVLADANVDSDGRRFVRVNDMHLYY